MIEGNRSFCIILWNFKIGGIQKHGVLLANHLVELGWDVTILYSEKTGDLLSRLDKRVILIPFKVPNTNNPLLLRVLYQKLKRILPESAVILCNGPNNFRQIGRINFLVKRWKLLFILQNDLEFTSGYGRFLKQFEIRNICNSSFSYIIALSKRQKQDHQERLGLKGLEIIPNFIDFEHQGLTKLNRKSPRAVSIGRYAYQKGYDLLLEAMKSVDKNIKVDVYGYGEEERVKLQYKAEEYELKNIVFNGPILNVYEVMSNYDFFILSSRYEPFGIVVAEALSCGLPVLTTDCDGPVDIINDTNGIIVSKNDSLALAAGLSKINHMIEAGHFSEGGVRESAKRYSLEIIVNKYLKILDRE